MWLRVLLCPSLIHDERSWRSYVDVKINTLNILSWELKCAEKRIVFLSNASYPYQSAESKYKLTRQVLEILLKHKFPVLILARYPLILRDLDLLKKLSWLKVSLSISSVPSSYYEPGVPPLQARITALKKLSDEMISTWMSLAPVIPQLILTDLELLFRKLEEVCVATATISLLRFGGYEESKEMFEYHPGRTASEVSKRSTEIREKIANFMAT